MDPVDITAWVLDDRMIWYPKPTLNDIIDSPNARMYVRFYTDGKVEMKREGYSYFWGAEIPDGHDRWMLKEYSGIPPSYMFA